MQQTLTVDLVENPVQYHKDIFVKYHLRKKCNQQEISKFLIEYFIEYSGCAYTYCNKKPFSNKVQRKYRKEFGMNLKLCKNRICRPLGNPNYINYILLYIIYID